MFTHQKITSGLGKVQIPATQEDIKSQTLQWPWSCILKKLPHD